MKRATTLTYEAIKFTKTGVRFYYLIDNTEYSFYISIDHSKINIDEESKTLVLLHIGLTFLIDIAAICWPKNIIIKTIFLSQEQLKFWQLALEESSLERAYIEKRNLQFLDIKWIIKAKKTQLRMFKKTQNFKNLTIAMTGGKESLTALKLFKNYPHLSLYFVDYNDKFSFHLSKVVRYLKTKFKYHYVNTNISHINKLMEIYECRAYSIFVIGQLIFNSLLYSDQIDYLMIGNEYSSNFGNAHYKGRLVRSFRSKNGLFGDPMLKSA